MSWLREAARHTSQLEAVLMKEYRLKRALLDGLWPFVANKGEKSYPEADESDTFWISTVLDIESRLYAARGMGKNETDASKKAFQMLQLRGHPDAPFL